MYRIEYLVRLSLFYILYMQFKGNGFNVAGNSFPFISKNIFCIRLKALI